MGKSNIYHKMNLILKLRQTFTWNFGIFVNNSSIFANTCIKLDKINNSFCWKLLPWIILKIMRETKICDLCKTSFTNISELNRYMNKKTCLKKGLEILFKPASYKGIIKNIKGINSNFFSLINPIVLQSLYIS